MQIKKKIKKMGLSHDSPIHRTCYGKSKLLILYHTLLRLLHPKSYIDYEYF